MMEVELPGAERRGGKGPAQDERAPDVREGEVVIGGYDAHANGVYSPERVKAEA